MARKQPHQHPRPAARKPKDLTKPAPSPLGGMPAGWETTLDPRLPGDAEGRVEVFAAFIAPLLEGSVDLAGARARCNIARFAWNVALEPPHRRPQRLAQVLSAVPADFQPMLRAELAGLLQRKDALFAEHDWLISDCSLLAQSDGTYQLVLVLAVPEFPEDEEPGAG